MADNQRDPVPENPVAEGASVEGRAPASSDETARSSGGFEEQARRWDHADGETDAIPAATVVLLRQTDQLQVLMLRRNSKLAFVGGMWVFPGGRVDEADRDGLAADDDLGAAQAAARRETEEEAGLDLGPADLVQLSHWTPPPGAPRRFSTWFFVAAAPTGSVSIDGGEIHDHMWTTAEHALAARDRGEVQLAPPTFVTLQSLARFDTAERALATLRGEPNEHFETRILDDDGTLVALWHGDAEYDAEKPGAPGARHRLRMARDTWVYERADDG